MNCSYGEGHILSVLVMMVKFFFRFFFAMFLNKVWEKEYFTDIKASKFLAMLSSWNTKLAIAMNCSYREGRILSILVMMVKFLFHFFSVNSWIMFEKRTILDIWKDPNSLQCFFVEIAKLGIAMSCSYREGHILSMLVRFFNGIAG